MSEEELKQIWDNLLNKLNETEKTYLAIVSNEKNKEIERLNNIINELEKHLQKEISRGRSEDNVWLMGCYDEDREILDKLHELKGADKE